MSDGLVAHEFLDASSASAGGRAAAKTRATLQGAIFNLDCKPGGWTCIKLIAARLGAVVTELERLARKKQSGTADEKT